MTYRLSVRPQAELDFFEAQEWYESQRPGLGDEFRATVTDLLERLQDQPFLYPEVHQGVRRAVMRRFPFLLYFSVTSDTVTVLACLHSKRDPDFHKERIR